MFSFFRVSSSFTSPVPSSFPSHYLFLPFSSFPYFFPCILHFLHFITLLISLSFLLFFHSCLSFFLSCFVLPLLPFHIFTILLMFVLSFYISFLHTFSSHFSSPSSFVSFLLSTILWFLVLIILSPLSYHSSTCSVTLVLLRVSHSTAVLLSPFR